jgi:hypothetical protein
MTEELPKPERKVPRVNAETAKLGPSTSKNQRYPNRPAEALIGLVAIGKFFGRPKLTALRWIKSGWLPAIQLPNGQWFTTRGVIDRVIIANYEEELRRRGWGPFAKQKPPRMNPCEKAAMKVKAAGEVEEATADDELAGLSEEELEAELSET